MSASSPQRIPYLWLLRTRGFWAFFGACLILDVMGLKVLLHG